MGRPKLPPDERRTKKGVTLAPEAWDKLARLAKSDGCSANRYIERIILAQKEEGPA